MYNSFTCYHCILWQRKERLEIRRYNNFLHSQLNVEIEKLNDLEERKVITNKKIENNYSKLIDDSEQLQQLEELMNLYYNFGLNREKYYRYYQNGILSKIAFGRI